MTLDSDNIRFMRIFTGVPGKGASSNSWVIENVFFSWFRTLRIRHLRKWGQYYYIVLFSPLSPFHWPQNTWPWMTLNGLNGHFTLYIHYYELPLTYLLLIYCRLFITRDATSWEVGKRSIANSDLQSGRIFGICGSIFRGRYIVGTLTNNAKLYRLVLLSALSPFHWLQNTWRWMTLNSHFALNSVLCRYVWSSEAWLRSLHGYS